MIRDLAFIQLTVADWPRALAWYRDVLGLEVTLRADADRFALLRVGQLKLALKEGRPVPGTVRLTLEVEDLTAALAVLAARGVAPEGPVTVSHEGYRRALVRDLDGYLLCLFDWKPAAPQSESG